MAWLRLYTDLIDHHKMHQLSDRTFRAFINILLTVKRDGVDGRLTIKDTALAWTLRTDIKTIRKAIKDLIDLKIY